MIFHYFLSFWTSIMDAFLLGRAPCSDSPSQKLLAKDSAHSNSELGRQHAWISQLQSNRLCLYNNGWHCYHDFTSAGKLHHSIHCPAQRKTPILQLRLLITAFWFAKIHLNSTTFQNGPQVADLNAICKVIFKEESVRIYSFFQRNLQVIYWVLLSYLSTALVIQITQQIIGWVTTCYRSTRDPVFHHQGLILE